MAEEMAELTATGSLEVEGPVSREDSAHDMAQGEISRHDCARDIGHPLRFHHDDPWLPSAT